LAYLPDRLKDSLVSQVAVQVLKLAASIGIGGWVARYLGPAGLGKISYVGALVGVLAPLGNLGVQGSLSALLCQQPQLPGLVSTALLIELLGTLVFTIAILPFALATKDPIIAALIGIAVIGNFFTSAEVFETELLNRQRGTVVARLGLLQTFAGAFLSGSALLLQAPLLVFGWLQVLQNVLRAWLLSSVFRGCHLLADLRQVCIPTALALIKRGLPLIIAGLSVSLYMKSDMVMLQWLKGSSAVGQYSVTVRVAESLYFLPVMLASTYMPRIGNRDLEFAENRELQQLYRLAWLLGIGMMLASILVLPIFIPVVFGPNYHQAQQALLLSGPAAFAVSTGCASGIWLQNMNLEWLSAIRTLLGCILNIGINLFLIPLIDINGASISTSVSYIIATFGVMLVFNPVTRRNAISLLFPFSSYKTWKC
jgi:O-antigen/teichoic acid export membrane protein